MTAPKDIKEKRKEEKLRKYRGKIKRLKNRLNHHRIEIALLRARRVASAMPSPDDKLFMDAMVRRLFINYRPPKLFPLTDHT